MSRSRAVQERERRSPSTCPLSRIPPCRRRFSPTQQRGKIRLPEDPGGRGLKRVRVVLADDHTLVREGIGKLLEPRFKLVGKVEDGHAAVEAAAKLRPDVILLDIAMPRLNGIDAARRIRELAPETKILMLSMHADPLYVTEAFRAGCRGYLLKHAAASELAFAIEQLLKGELYVSPAIAKRGAKGFSAERGARPTVPPLEAPSLTPRQREVIQLVAEGKSIKEIASSLGISVKTVEFHKSRIMSQLDLHTTADLTKFAIARGIVTLES